jgi:hypothetical protein
VSTGASSRAMVWAATLWAAGSPSQAPGVGGSPGVAVGIGHLTSFGGLHGFRTHCWAIRLPMTTKAIPTSSLVPWIIALHMAPSSVDGPETAMQALEMSVASLRLQPTLPMRWPTTTCGIHNVQRTLGRPSGSGVEDDGEHEGGLTMWHYQSFLKRQRAWGTSRWSGSVGATHPQHGLVAHVGWGPSVRATLTV